MSGSVVRSPGWPVLLLLHSRMRARKLSNNVTQFYYFQKTHRREGERLCEHKGQREHEGERECQREHGVFAKDCVHVGLFSSLYALNGSHHLTVSLSGRDIMLCGNIKLLYLTD